MRIRPIQPAQFDAAKRAISAVILELFTEEAVTLDAVARMQQEHQAQGEFRDMDDPASGYFAPGGVFLVLLDGETVVGTGALRPLTEGIGEVKRIWLLPNYRGRGLGRKMLEELLAFARQFGYSAVRLDSHRTLAQAHRLYARTGFHLIERYNNAPADEFVFMEMTLSSKETVVTEAYSLVLETIAGLPCLTLAPAETSPDAPPVIVLHGLGRSKEWMLPTLYAFARRGLRAVAPDVRLHGERPGAAERDMRLLADYVGTMAEMIEGTVWDVSQLLDGLGVPSAAVFGLSLGGYVAFAALVAEPRLAVGTVALGSPDWLEPLREMGLALGHPLYDAIAARSPLERAVDAYPPRPLLMMHGDQDESVAIAGVRALYERLEPAYRQNPDRLELIVYPGLDHSYTDDMMQRAADWAARFLSPPPR